MQFTRGLDPRAAMNIGTTTWNNIGQGNILRTKKYVSIGQTLNNEDVFARDRRTEVWGRSIPNNHYLLIRNITRTYKTRKGQNVLVNVNLEYTQYLTLEEMNIETTWTSLNSLRGSFEQFKNHFEIIQCTRL